MDGKKFLDLTCNKHVLENKIKDFALIDGGDLYNPIEEPNPALDGSSGHPKPRPDCSLRARRFGTIIMPPKVTRRMSCSSIQPQV